MTQDKIGHSCTLFSKPRVWQSILKMPNPEHHFVPFPGQVWLHSSLMRAVGTRGSGTCTLRGFSNETSWRTDWGRLTNHEYI